MKIVKITKLILGQDKGNHRETGIEIKLSQKAVEVISQIYQMRKRKVRRGKKYRC